MAEPPRVPLMNVLSVFVFLEGYDRNRKTKKLKKLSRAKEKLNHGMKTFASDRALGYKHQDGIRQQTY